MLSEKPWQSLTPGTVNHIYVCIYAYICINEICITIYVKICINMFRYVYYIYMLVPTHLYPCIQNVWYFISGWNHQIGLNKAHSTWSSTGRWSAQKSQLLSSQHWKSPVNGWFWWENHRKIRGKNRETHEINGGKKTGNMFYRWLNLPMLEYWSFFLLAGDTLA